MSKEKKPISITGKWQPFHESIPAFANVFRLTWGEDGIILTIGLLDPEYFLPGAYNEKSPPIVRIIGRFNLGPSGFLSLKSEIDKAYNKMKEAGLIK